MDCQGVVVARSLIPRKPRIQVKANRRNAMGLVKLLRAGEQTAVCVSERCEAMRIWGLVTLQRSIENTLPPSCSNIVRLFRAKSLEQGVSCSYLRGIVPVFENLLALNKRSQCSSWAAR